MAPPLLLLRRISISKRMNMTVGVLRKLEDYVAGSKAIAKRVGYNGVILRVYIWMEGTDADCVNNAAAEDTATYNVTVRLAGVSAE